MRLSLVIVSLLVSPLLAQASHFPVLVPGSKAAKAWGLEIKAEYQADDKLEIVISWVRVKKFKHGSLCAPYAGVYWDEVELEMYGRLDPKTGRCSVKLRIDIRKIPLKRLTIDISYDHSIVPAKKGAPERISPTHSMCPPRYQVDGKTIKWAGN